MTRIHFTDLPFIVQLASVSVYFLGWVTFAELIIDRHGLDKYLPYYRLGNLCPYDIVVIVALGIMWMWLTRK